MGIKHLGFIVGKKCPGGKSYFKNVGEFMKSEHKRLFCHTETEPYCLGIDARLYAHKYKRECVSVEYGFLRQILLSLSYGMIPIYVFDGNAPKQKAPTIQKRISKRQRNNKKLERLIDTNKSCYQNRNYKEIINHINDSRCHQIINGIAENGTIDPEISRLIKQSISVESNDFTKLKNFFSLLKIPYITAKGEADDLMAILYEKGIIHACQSDDMDMLPKGCGNLIQISSKGVIQYRLAEILSELQLKHEQFVDLCILLGSDYYTCYLPKMDAIALYNLFKQAPSLEQFVSRYAEIDDKILLHLQSYQDVRPMFMARNETANDFDLSAVLDKLVQINYDAIKNYFKKIGIILNPWHQKEYTRIIRLANEFIVEISQYRKLRHRNLSQRVR